MTSPITAVLDSFPPEAQSTAHKVIEMIRDEANRLHVGPLTETLKWGEPAFLTEATKSGTTIRVAWKAKKPDAIQLLVHCQTTLIDTWRGRFPDLRFDGNRALLIPLNTSLPEAELRYCIAQALTYHRPRP